MSKKYPGLSANKSISAFFVHETSGIVHETSVITYVLRVKYDAKGWDDEFNRSMHNWGLKVKFKEALTAIALKQLKINFERWEFKVLGSDIHRT